MMSKYQNLKSLLLIGAGNWGKNLVRNFHALGVLHTICDSNDAILNQYAALYPDVQLAENYEEALANPEINKVVIAAPAALHFSLAKQALESGKDVFVEKPLCLISDEGQNLISLAESRGLILMVGHLLQYHPCVVRLQEMAGKGELGKLQYIASNRLNLGSIRTEENALWSFAPHDISVILSLCNHAMPEHVSCTGGAYLSSGIADNAMTTMKFADQLRAHVYVSWLNPFKEQKLVVMGSSGMIVFDDTKSWDDKLILYRNTITWNQGNIPQANKSEPEKIVIPQTEPLRNECEHFLKCCQTRTPPKSDGKEGLRVLKVLQAAQTSLSNEGKNVSPDNLASSAKNYFAHPTAVIDADAEIEDGVKIWHFSHIMQNAHIGKHCNIGQNVVISPGVTLGKNVKVQNNVSIYTGVVCEDDVFLGPSMVFTNVINPRSAVNRRGVYQTTLIKRGVTIGANATIICGIVLEEFSFIGAGAVVTKNTQPFALMVGNPAKQIGWMSRHGESLNLPISLPDGEMMEETCPATGECYRLTGSSLSLIANTHAPANLAGISSFAAQIS